MEGAGVPQPASPAGSVVFDVAGEVWKIGARIEEVDLCGGGLGRDDGMG